MCLIDFEDTPYWKVGRSQFKKKKNMNSIDNKRSRTMFQKPRQGLLFCHNETAVEKSETWKPCKPAKCQRKIQ